MSLLFFNFELKLRFFSKNKVNFFKAYKILIDSSNLHYIFILARELAKEKFTAF